LGEIGYGWGANGDKQGLPLYEVKWEGYEKKSDRTWEPEENLMYETAALPTLQTSADLLS
jgi:hypothetical protein